jgi:ATP-binding cassette, subfamily B, bacterial
MSIHYWPNILGLFLLGLVSAPLALLGPLPLKVALDSVIGSEPLPAILQGLVPASLAGSDRGLLAVLVLLVVGTALISQVRGLLASLLRTVTGERMLLENRARVFRHLQRMSLAYHDSRGTTDSIYRLQYDTLAIQSIVVDSLVTLLTSIITFSSMIYVMLLIAPELALLAVTVTPVLAVAAYVSRRVVRKRSREVKRLESQALSVVQEVLTSLRVVKAFGQEDRERERFLDESKAGVRARTKLVLLEGGIGLLRGVAMSGGVAAVLVVGVTHVQRGDMSIGNLILVMGYLGQLYSPLRTITQRMGGLQGSLASAERVIALLDEAPDVPERPGAKALQRALGSVEFRNVSFVYGDGRAALHDVSFTVPPGARVGIVGATGAGKTTLVNLLTRFFDPTEGEILLDGVDLRDYRLADLRNQYAIVLQEPILFSTSIAENIGYAKPEAAPSEVIGAARAAHIHDFVERLPDAYETLVGERGMQLSGGERQRVALARAFLKDAPVVILDEPTSSVDTRTERMIVDAMERLMKGRTTFMVAHRLSTLSSCDLLLEMEGGRLTAVRTDVHSALAKISASTA